MLSNAGANVKLEVADCQSQNTQGMDGKAGDAPGLSACSLCVCVCVCVCVGGVSNESPHKQR